MGRAASAPELGDVGAGRERLLRTRDHDRFHGRSRRARARCPAVPRAAQRRAGSSEACSGVRRRHHRCSVRRGPVSVMAGPYPRGDGSRRAATRPPQHRDAVAPATSSTTVSKRVHCTRRALAATRPRPARSSSRRRARRRARHRSCDSRNPGAPRAPPTARRRPAVGRDRAHDRRPPRRAARQIEHAVEVARGLVDAGPVGLVHDEHVGDLEQPRLRGLHRVAPTGVHDHDGRVGVAGDLDLDLADADRLDHHHGLPAASSTRTACGVASASPPR